MKKTIWQKICLICPLCNYTRKCKTKNWKYHLFSKIESICPICKLAKLNLPISSTVCGDSINVRVDDYFENRYKLQPIKKDSIQIKEAILKTYQKNLQFLTNSEQPKGIEYYEKILSADFRINELKELKLQGKKIVGTFCNFVPEEFIYSCDAIPVRLCAGCYETISPAEEVLPRDICPLIKSSFGFKLIENSCFALCDLVIMPTTCDGKKKLCEILNDYLPVWILELPQGKKIPQALNSWIEQIKALKTKLEEFTKTKITLKKLKESVLLLHKRNSIFRKLYDLKKHKSIFLSGRDTAIVIQASFYDDIQRWIQKTNQLCEEVKQRTTNNELRTTRLLLTGAPVIWPNFKILNIIENANASIVADELCSGMQYLYNTVEVDEWTETAILKAIATKYLLPSTCPCFTESNDRIDRLLNLIEEFHVDGVVYHSLRLCQLYDIELYKVRQALKSKNIPLITIHTDYSQEDIEQIKTRIEAFLEMLKSRIKNHK